MLRTSSGRLTVLLLMLGTASCGGSTSSETPGGKGGSAGSGGTTSDAGGSGGTAGTGGTGGGSGGVAGTGATGGAAGMGGTAGTGGTGGGGAAGMGGAAGQGGQGGAACEALSKAIGDETTGVFTCTTVVRLGYESLAILGFQLSCGKYAQADETTARATADADTGYGLAGNALSGATPQDEYVFWEPPGDFGGVGVVNARNGLSVFGGSIIWGGTGEISFPADWRPAADLGPDCIPMTNALPPPSRGFDLSAGGTELGAAEVDDALTQAWVTALPDGLMQGGYVFDAVVLLYPRTVGVFEPSTAEWIVMVNSGWLE